jgi:hypothetical protein
LTLCILKIWTWTQLSSEVRKNRDVVFHKKNWVTQDLNPSFLHSCLWCLSLCHAPFWSLLFWNKRLNSKNRKNCVNFIEYHLQPTKNPKEFEEETTNIQFF